MDTATVWGFIQECLYLLIVFGVFFVYTMSKGRQSITNLILGLYFALLISLEFPYYDLILGNTSNAKSEAILSIIVFTTFTIFATVLFARLMPREYDEGKFEGFGKKVLLAASATVLVMIFSYHVLPVTDIITPGSPINYLFSSGQSFFWWLMAPLVLLFLV